MHKKSIMPHLSRALAGAYRFAQDTGPVTLPIIIIGVIAEVLAAQLRALSRILAPYRDQPLNRAALELTLQLARLEPAQ